MGSSLHDAAVVNVHDPVTVADRGEAMGDDKRSPSLKHGIETGLQSFFRLHVNAGGGFVKDQNGRIRKQRPGKRDKLFLPLTQHGAALPDLRIIPFRHPADELIGTDDPAGFLDFLFRGGQFAVADVVSDGAGENEAVLHHDPHLGTEGVDGHIRDILAVNEDTAAVHVVEA